MKNLKQLLEEYSDGKITLKEMIELSDKINDGQSQEAEELLKEEWENQLKVEKSNARNLKPVLNEIHHRICLKENRPASRFRRWWQGFQKVAAILIIPVIVGFFVFFYSQAQSFKINDSYAEIQCPMGARTKFILPDGSTGFLNSGSTLKFPVVFTKDRSVELTGEGYFDIGTNNTKPFYVRTKNLNIEIKGHSLNVIANENEHTEEVVLQEGKINIYSKDGKLLGVLSSDEQLILDTKKHTITTQKVNASIYSAWKEGKLIFSNDNLSKVIQRLNRWYNADIVWIDNHNNDHYSLQGTFVDEPLDEVLKYISEKTSLKYKEDLRTFNTDGVFNRRKITIQAQQIRLGQLK
jgi:ferric-dicitrate binding protein FerR (iron transport regulator)